jgi:anti-sigma-K factor RskA
MSGHPQHEEDFDLYALGALEGEEKQALEVHVAECAACAEKLAEARGRVSLLALAAKPMAPPSSVKAKLMQQVREENQPARARAEAKREERTGGLFGRWTLAWVGAAAVLALATGFLWYQNMKLDEKIQQAVKEAAESQKRIENARNLIELLQAPDSMMVSLASLDVPQATGKVAYNARLGKLACSTHLSAPPADKSYQLWLVPMVGNPVSAGLIAPNMISTDDMWITDVKGGATAKAFAVTLEPAGGMPQPTGPKVLIGLAPQAISSIHPNVRIQAYSMYAAGRRAAGDSSPDGSVHAEETTDNMR